MTELKTLKDLYEGDGNEKLFCEDLLVEDVKEFIRLRDELDYLLHRKLITLEEYYKRRSKLTREDLKNE